MPWKLPRSAALPLALLTLGCLDPERLSAPTAEFATAAAPFAWRSASPESQGMCGTIRQLGCTKTLAEVWTGLRATRYATQRLIVIRNDRVVFDSGTKAAVFVYSSNKGLLGAPTLVHAMNDCGLRLTDPAANWLHGSGGARWDVSPWKKITIEHLATHTSGVCDYSNVSPVCHDENGGWQRDFISAKGGGDKYVYPKDALTVARLRSEQNQNPAAAPGKRYEYSNVGHALLNYAVQQACGQNLADIYATYIRQPGMGSPVAPAMIHTDGGRTFNQSAGIARWKGLDGAGVLRLAARLGIWENRNVEPVRYWNALTKITDNLAAAAAVGRGVIYGNNGTDLWTRSPGHLRLSQQMFGHNGNYSTVFMADPLTSTIIVRQGTNNAVGASYLTKNGCAPGWTGTAPSCTQNTVWDNNWGEPDSLANASVVGPRNLLVYPLQEAFFFPPPFCRMTAAAGAPVDQVTDVYDIPASSTTFDLRAEIRVNPREGAGSSVVDRVEFYREDGTGSAKLMGTGTLVTGTKPAQYRLSYGAANHGAAGSTVTYFASCVAKSTQDPTKKVPSYSRPVRLRRAR